MPSCWPFQTNLAGTGRSCLLSSFGRVFAEWLVFDIENVALFKSGASLAFGFASGTRTRRAVLAGFRMLLGIGRLDILPWAVQRSVSVAPSTSWEKHLGTTASSVSVDQLL